MLVNRLINAGQRPIETLINRWLKTSSLQTTGQRLVTCSPNASQMQIKHYSSAIQTLIKWWKINEHTMNKRWSKSPVFEWQRCTIWSSYRMRLTGIWPKYYESLTSEWPAFCRQFTRVWPAFERCSTNVRILAKGSPKAGQILTECRLNAGQRWSKAGQILVEVWPNSDQTNFKSWSFAGEVLGLEFKPPIEKVKTKTHLEHQTW